jgi:DNA-binding MarR family transcriptional regulator
MATTSTATGASTGARSDGARSDGARTAGTRWLNETEAFAWRAFIEHITGLLGAFEADLVASGTTLGDYQVLVHLSEAEEQSLRMCDLAERLELSPSGLTRRLDGLVRAGLVSRRGADDDRRVMLATLTPQGRATLERIAPEHVASVRRHLFDHLDHEQVVALGSIFTAVGDALAQHDPT